MFSILGLRGGPSAAVVAYALTFTFGGGTQSSVGAADPGIGVYTPDFAPGTDPKYIATIQQQIRAAAERAREKSGGQIDYQIAGRWPGAMTDPIQLTWSFMPDDTLIYGGGPPGVQVASTLFARMNNLFPTQAAWMDVFENAFARWDEFSGITFERVSFANGADDGAPWNTPGEPGRRGDIRIGMANIDGLNGVLAFGQEPQQPSPGEIVLDFAEPWNAPTWSPLAPQFAMLNSITHEIGHAVGIDHVCPVIGTKVMEPNPGLRAFWGPQHDDLRAVQSLYGDGNESNDTHQTATPLNVPGPGGYLFYNAIDQAGGTRPFGPPPIASGQFSIDRWDDADYYTFTIGKAQTIFVTLDPVGLVYQSYAESCPVGTCCVGPMNEFSEQIADLVVEVLDRNLLVLSRQQTNAGNATSLTAHLRFADVPYYIRVRPLNANPNAFQKPQCYDLVIPEVNEGPHCDSNDPLGSCTDGILQNGVEVCLGGTCFVAPLEADCNQNWWEDKWDVESGASQDCDENGIPDECEPDCNGNGRSDVCDIVLGPTQDCDGNGIPDECQDDCNLNGVADVCELTSLTDANDNDVLDECEETRLVPAQYTTLAGALAVSNHGDTILIAPGMYSGTGFRDLVIIDKTLQIESTGVAAATTIDLQSAGRGMYIASVNRPNKTRIQGIWFKNGNANNTATGWWAGRGGALFVDDADVRIERCIFSGNTASIEGGAVAFQGSDGTTDTRVLSALFFGNSSESGGAVAILSSIYPNLLNCTFADNTAMVAGAVYTSGQMNGGGLTNCIVWNNANAQIVDLSGGALVVNYCSLPNELIGEYDDAWAHNVFGDPLFSATNPYRIRRVSPCVDEGFSGGGYGSASFDVDGQPRSFGIAVDIGADEWQ